MFGQFEGGNAPAAPTWVESFVCAAAGALKSDVMLMAANAAARKMRSLILNSSSFRALRA